MCAGLPDTEELFVDAGVPDAEDDNVDAGLPDTDELIVDAGVPDKDDDSVDAGLPDTDGLTVGTELPDTDELTVVAGLPVADELTDGAGLPDTDDDNVDTELPDTDDDDVGAGLPETDDDNVIAAVPEMETEAEEVIEGVTVGLAPGVKLFVTALLTVGLGPGVTAVSTVDELVWLLATANPSGLVGVVLLYSASSRAAIMSSTGLESLVGGHAAPRPHPPKRLVLPLNGSSAKSVKNEYWLSAAERRTRTCR